MSVGGGGGDGEAEAEDEVAMPLDVGEYASVHDVARLHASAKLQGIVSRINKFSSQQRQAGDMKGPVEADPEYVLIVDANNLAADIDNEISVIFMFGKDKYSKRFPELDTLVVQPLEYLLTAKELRNNILKAKNNKVLEQFLTQATIMVVSVTASTTQGVPIEDADIDHMVSACDMALRLSETKRQIFEYVESRMSFIAPNISRIIGASIAAKLMGAAGGLTHLSKMPSNNIALLGQQKKSQSGFSQNAVGKGGTLPHTGYIYYCDLVQNSPPDIRRKASRIVANKTTLAARVDSQHEAPLGDVGQSMKDEIEKKIEKWQEPPPVKAIRALKAPMDAPKKKRGGRRVRAMKERYAVTEMRKQANRMNFGEIEEDVAQNNLGYSRGNIGKSSIGGGIRMAAIDERTKTRISQTLKKNLQKQQQWGGASTVKKQVSGTASSVAFTPLQGLEIVNPQAAEDKIDRQANAKYFGSASTFTKVRSTVPRTT